MTWTLQGAWVYLTSCAAAAVISSIPLDWMRCSLWALASGPGFAIEVIADRQKTAFRADPDNAHRFISSDCGPGRGTLITLAKSYCGRALL